MTDSYVPVTQVKGKVRGIWMNLQAVELEPWKLWDRSRYQTCIVLGIPLGWDGVLVILASIRMASISIRITLLKSL